MTLNNRSTVRQEYLRRTGGHVAALTSAGDTTSLISTGMIGRGRGDDTYFKGWGTYDGTDAAADAYRIATAWDDSAGDATIPAMSGARAGTETIEYYPRDDPSPFEANEVLNRVLSETKRITEMVIPTSDSSRRFELFNAPWIERHRDIADVQMRGSPNICTNSDFEAWGRGSDASLQGWVLAGTGATVTRVDGPYSYAARVTRASNDVTLTQTIPIPITQLYGETISLFGRIKCSTIDVAFIRVNDGTDTTDSGNHDSGGDWDEFTISHTVNADAVGPLTIELHLIDSDVSADYEHVVAVKGGSVPDWLSKYGDQHLATYPIQHTVQMYNPNPVIETSTLFNQGAQLVVMSRQPYAPLTADSGSGGVTDMPLQVAVAGMISKMAKQYRGPNKAHWDELYRDYYPEYRSYVRTLRSLENRPTPTRVLVGPG